MKLNNYYRTVLLRAYIAMLPIAQIIQEKKNKAFMKIDTSFTKADQRNIDI